MAKHKAERRCPKCQFYFAGPMSLVFHLLQPQCWKPGTRSNVIS